MFLNQRRFSYLMQRSQYLRPLDMLDLYLVEKGLKPATRLAFDATDTHLSPFVHHDERQMPSMAHIRDRFISEFVLEVEKMVYDTGRPYSVLPIQPRVLTNKQPPVTMVHDLLWILVGDSQPNLERLIHAKSDVEFGAAFGYPPDAIAAFGKVINGEKRDGHSVLVAMARAVHAGIPIPPWLAYIPFVPSELDIVNGRYSPSAQEMGERNRAFVLKHNPVLAMLAEGQLYTRKMPVSWVLGSNGSYSCTFTPKKVIS